MRAGDERSTMDLKPRGDVTISRLDNCGSLKSTKQNIYRPHPKDGKLIFSQVSVRSQGEGGLSHLYPIILPLVPGPFWGGGESIQERICTPPGTGQEGVPPVQDRKGWVTPPHHQTGYAWTVYGTGSMPLAVSSRRTFLFFKNTET